MPGDITLPKLKDPKAIKAAIMAKAKPAEDSDPLGSRKAALKGLPAIVGRLVDLGSEIDQIQSPTAREAARSFFKGMYSDALGFSIDLPNAEDLEMKELRRRSDRAGLLKEVAQNELRQARAFLMDDPRVKQFGDPGEIMKDPDQMISTLNALGIESITRGTFELAADTEAAGKSKADVAREKAKEQAGDLQRESQSLLDIQQIGKRAETLDQPIEDLLGKAEEAAGVSLGGLFSDVDTDRGSAALLSAYDGMRRIMGPTVGKSLARRFLSQIGSDMTDQLEGLPKNEKGELVVGQGDRGVTPAATVNLGMLILLLSKDSGMSPAQIMKELKLDYSGIDIDSLKHGQQALAQQFGETQAQVQKAFGLQE